MTINPEDQQRLYRRLRNRLRNADTDTYHDTTISGLTNFEEGSFNRVWTQSFSEGLRDAQIRALAAQLSGWIDYAGKELTESDLEELGIDDLVEPDQINQYMQDEHLDELVAILNVQRDPATRTVMKFRVYSDEDRDVTVPTGTRFGTEPDRRGGQLIFETEEEVVIPSDPDDHDSDYEVGEENGETYAEVDGTALEAGEQHNLPPGTVRTLINPPSGVSGVTNIEIVEEGAAEQDTESLRQEAKEALGREAQGGTVRGMTGYIIENTEATDVIIDEFREGNNPNRPEIAYPHAEVVVEGGDEENILEAIEESRPVAVKHFYEQPENISVGVTTLLEGENIDTDNVADNIRSKIAALGLGDDLYRDRIVQRIMNADRNITTIDELDIEIQNEEAVIEQTELTVTRSSDDRDDISGLYDGELDVILTVQQDSTFYQYNDEWERDGDEIVWNADVIDEGEEYTVNILENIEKDAQYVYQGDVDEYAVLEPFNEIISVFSGDTEFVEDEDYIVTDTGIEFIDGDRPAVGDRFTIRYLTNRSLIRLRKPKLLDEVISVTSAGDEITRYEVTAENELQLLDGATVICEEACLNTTYTVEGDIITEEREKLNEGIITVKDD